MSAFDSIILGVIQGLAEFLPISSSGHLIIARDLFGWHGSTDLAFDAVLQLATIMAVIFYFWKDILHLIKSFFLMISGKKIEKTDKNMLGAIILGTIPAIIIGMTIEEHMETTFRSAFLVCIVLIIGSGLMLLAEKFAKQNKELNIKKGIAIGFFQCLALIPGFSRSGATISGGLLLGLKREDAARFSFLLSIPIIFGSGLKKFLEIIQTGSFATDNLNLFFGSLTAFVVGIFAIEFLMRFLKKYPLNIFIYYRVILATVVMSILLFR
jgi:undecaprenyl-diphosphatase